MQMIRVSSTGLKSTIYRQTCTTTKIWTYLMGTVTISVMLMQMLWIINWPKWTHLNHIHPQMKCCRLNRNTNALPKKKNTESLVVCTTRIKLIPARLRYIQILWSPLVSSTVFSMTLGTTRTTSSPNSLIIRWPTDTCSLKTAWTTRAKTT